MSTLSRSSYDVVIIGAGQAGFQVAASLRMKKFAGSILLVGDETYPPYQRPPLSKAALKDGLDEGALWFRPEAFYEAQQLDVLLDTSVVSIDTSAKTVSLSGGDMVGYGDLVLATGARPRTLPASLGIPQDAMLVLRSLDDAKALRPRLKDGSNIAVIGAGYIGLEVAATARLLGSSVTVIDLAERAMQRTASPAISAHFEALHKHHGVQVYMQDSVAAVEGNTLKLASGTPVPFDTVVVGIGVSTNDALALEAGLEVRDGIVTDLTGRTSEAHIYAAGDCARHAHTGFGETVRFESVQSAIDQGKVVASSILGGDEQHSAVPWFWSDQYDTKLQVVGVPDETCTMMLRGAPETGSFAIYHMRENTPIAVEAVNAPQDFVAARKSVGTDRPLAEDILAALRPV